MLERGKLDRGILEMVDTESLVPEGHLLRKIDAAVDFNRLYEMANMTDAELKKRAADQGVLIRCLSDFAHENDQNRHTLVINYSGLDTSRLGELAERLETAFHE